ncbi:hypothetical protein BDV29DRAFT_196020 [Aspergillus leporis]|uniref:Zn(2)-C6 fungal-type domain-containing protein n=1 Tax=Aspergillus leporis TaxID=41062 RepID=A0A5N5WLT2_9EURO|nr:hypothetical protein BDV29DRAFT_196020 [Aspergillus leporis]
MKSRPPVKAACLPCRSSKIRCDGQNPCQACFQRDRICAYRQSRRGGRRQRGQKQGKVSGMVVSDTAIPPLSLSGPSVPCGAAECIASSGNKGRSEVQSIDPILQNITALLSHSGGLQDQESLPDAHLIAQDMQGSGKIGRPMLRAYTSEKDIVNAYYIYIHPYLPLLPPPPVADISDRPKLFEPQPEVVCTVSKSSLPYWPISSLSLAFSAILALIPPSEDQNPTEECNVWLRRSYAHFFAQAAFTSAEKEIDEHAIPGPRPTNLVNQGCLHPDVTRQLHPILALVVLSMYEFCQCGSVARMRNRANQALITAMDFSLHALGSSASEAQRRAWWAAAFVVHHSSILHFSAPIITASDPRINTPFPIIGLQADVTEPWPILLGAEEAMLSVAQVVDPKQSSQTPALNLGSQIRHLDSYLLSLSVKCYPYMTSTDINAVEAQASQCMGMIAYIVIHSARIRLHRFRAFREIPIFFNKHCDLSAISENEVFPMGALPELPAHYESLFPFTEQESLVTCLKSSLSVVRTLRDLARPNPFAPVDTRKDTSTAKVEIQTIYNGAATMFIRPFGALPYFKCAAMQAGYSLCMLLHRVRAALASKHLLACYPLLANPSSETEVDDARRLLEELRYGIESLILSLKQDVIFEGIAAMSRELDAVYLSLFPA